MTKKTLPVLKAWERIFELLECIKNHPYDRDGFQEAVLKLYESKSPKSVFRGMAVPTLRRLGFIVGYADVIRISANGALVHTARQESKSEGLRALRAVLLEMDDEIELLSYLENKPAVPIQVLIDDWTPKIDIPDSRVVGKPEARDRAARERLGDWIDFLTFAELLYKEQNVVRVDAGCLTQARNDIAPHTPEKREGFEKNFIQAYKEIVLGQSGIRTVEIERLREELAIRVYSQSRLLITEKQFDALLKEYQKTSDRYTITFGRSMGADEKLFFFQNKYYQTVSIRFYS
jgi:hypothetical protein